MNLSKMTEDVSNITVQPNQFIGKASDLKKLFDKSGEDIKDYINNTLIPELEKLKLSDIANDGNGISPFATTEEVAQAIANLVDSSPDALDTLKELADALGNDPEFSTTVLNLIGTKVDKGTYEEDKSRLENDILDLESTKVANSDFLSFKNENINKINTKVDKTSYEKDKESLENDISNLEREIVNNASGKCLSEEEKQKLSDLPTNEELQRVLETKATKEEVDSKIAQISGSVPETMIKDYIDKKLDSPRDKILLTDQTTQEIYKLYVDNGVIKVFNTKDSILVMGNNATVNEEVLILSNDIATVLNETLLINEGTLK